MTTTTPTTPTLRFFMTDGSVVTFMSAGWVPDPTFPGMSRYSYGYTIQVPTGRIIDASDVRGPCDSPFPVGEALRSWASFMIARGEAYSYDMTIGQSGTDADGDPLTEIDEWAYLNDSELQALADDTDDME